ncbi:unnamed protein product [Blepharisma stoltei]|uniref:Cyclic nucleotide-binding domain-containing protein n=1 Tax=Blepharisma stoltei TaxID=1481888 RepID=A0AAU9I9N4_9CILI|nr:unnamed protein product [Blepharisma stoltei]
MEKSRNCDLSTKRDLEPDDYDEVDFPKYLFHPGKLFKTIWNMIISALLLYTAFGMTFVLSFYETSMYDSWWYVENVLNGVFFCDILITFNSAYEADEVIITNRWKIAWNYITGWFWIDLIACFPFYLWSGNGNTSYSGLLRLARLPRLVKLLRLSRLFKMMKGSRNNEFMQKVEEFLSIKRSAMRLCSFILLVIVLLHLVACLFNYASKFEDYSYKTWVVVNNFQDFETGSLYLRALYWALTTLVTVGYGDITAQNTTERLVSIIWMAFVLFFFTFAISSLSTMISGIDTKASVTEQKLALIEEFCNESGVGFALKKKLKDSLIYSTDRTGGSLYDKQSVFMELPRYLRYEVSMFMHQGAARTLSFFKDKDPVFVSSVVPFLINQHYAAGDIIYDEKDYPEEMYFVLKGRIGYVYSGEDSIIFKHLRADSYFGEIEMFKDINRRFTVKCMEPTELLVLEKKILKDVLTKFPRVALEMKKIADERDLSNLIAKTEMKEIAKLRKTGEITQFTHLELRKYIKDRCDEAKLSWKDEKQEEIDWAELYEKARVTKERVQKLKNLHDTLKSTVEKIAETWKSSC